MSITHAMLGCSGRLDRKSYRRYCGYLVTPLVLLSAFAPKRLHEDSHFLAVLLLYTAVLWWPLLTLAIKRCHDMDRSGLWAAIPMSGYTGLLLVLIYVWLEYGDLKPYYRLATLDASLTAILLVMVGWGLFVPLDWIEGTPGPNRFGPDPAPAKSIS